MGLGVVNIDGDLIKGTLDGFGTFLGKVRSAITGKLPPEQEAALISEASRLDAGLMTAQVEVNKIEAAHRSIFVAGWRPFIGWVCGISLLYNYLVRDMAIYGVQLYAFFSTDGRLTPPLPPLWDISQLLAILMALLGMATLRSYDKKENLTK